MTTQDGSNSNDNGNDKDILWQGEDDDLWIRIVRLGKDDCVVEVSTADSPEWTDYIDDTEAYRIMCMAVMDLATRQAP